MLNFEFYLNSCIFVILWYLLVWGVYLSMTIIYYSNNFSFLTLTLFSMSFFIFTMFIYMLKDIKEELKNQFIVIQNLQLERVLI